MRLAKSEARARFAAQPVVRLGTADARGWPHIVVVTFVVQGDLVYTAVDQKPKSGTNLKRLRNVAENPLVTMLADRYSDDWDTLWWARADGRAQILADQTLMAGPLRLLADRYWQYQQAPPTGPVIAVTVERWSGWAAAPADNDTGAAGTRPSGHDQALGYLCATTSVDTPNRRMPGVRSKTRIWAW